MGFRPDGIMAVLAAARMLIGVLMSGVFGGENKIYR